MTGTSQSVGRATNHIIPGLSTKNMIVVTGLEHVCRALEGDGQIYVCIDKTRAKILQSTVLLRSHLQIGLLNYNSAAYLSIQ